MHSEEMMNAPYNGHCYFNNVSSDYYNVPADANGDSILTGDGKAKKKFTIKDLETWVIKY